MQEPDAEGERVRTWVWVGKELEVMRPVTDSVRGRWDMHVFAQGVRGQIRRDEGFVVPGGDNERGRSSEEERGKTEDVIIMSMGAYNHVFLFAVWIQGL